MVSEQWVADSLKPSPSFEGYGYKWWLLGREDNRIPEDTYAAIGVDEQYIYVIPSLELVVVRNGIYKKHDGEPVADPNLFGKLPAFGLQDDLGSVPPDSWDDAQFLTPIVDSITD